MVESHGLNRRKFIRGIAGGAALYAFRDIPFKNVRAIPPEESEILSMYDISLAEEFPLQEAVTAQNLQLVTAQGMQPDLKYHLYAPQVATGSTRPQYDGKVILTVPGVANGEVHPQPATKLFLRPEWSDEVLHDPAFSGPNDRPLVGLTIDDGYYNRKEIIDVLAAKKVFATLFPIGKIMEQDMEFVKRAIESGQEIANHSYSHEDMTRKTEAEINREWDLNEAIVGSAVKGATTVPFARPYGGNKSLFSIDVTAKRRYRTMLWNISGDAGNYTPDQLINLYMGQIDRMKNPWGSIVLLHFRPATLQALPSIIDGIRYKGMEPVSLTKLFESNRN